MAIELTTATTEQLQGIRSALEVGDRNTANGFAGLDSNGDLVGTVLQRVGLAAAIATIVLKNGEIAYCTDTKDIFIGDGVTAGGIFLLGKWKWWSEFLVGTVYTNTTIALTSFVAGGIYEWVAVGKHVQGTGGTISFLRIGLASGIAFAEPTNGGFGVASFTTQLTGTQSFATASSKNNAGIITTLTPAFSDMDISAANNTIIARGMLRPATPGSLVCRGTVPTTNDGMMVLFGIRRLE